MATAFDGWFGVALLLCLRCVCVAGLFLLMVWGFGHVALPCFSRCVGLLLTGWSPVLWGVLFWV